MALSIFCIDSIIVVSVQEMISKHLPKKCYPCASDVFFITFVWSIQMMRFVMHSNCLSHGNHKI